MFWSLFKRTQVTRRGNHSLLVSGCVKTRSIKTPNILVNLVCIIKYTVEKVCLLEIQIIILYNYSSPGRDSVSCQCQL